MPEKTLTKISKEDLYSLEIVNNKVLVEITETNEDRTSKGGIILGMHMEKIYGEGVASHAADLAPVIGYIHTLPESLYFKRGEEDSMPWETEMEVKDGDKVVFDYLDGMNCDELMVDDRLFKILDYSALYVAVRGETLIPLNGYCLLEPHLKGTLSEFDIKYGGREDFTRATVKHLAKPNKKYNDINKTDDIGLKVGDVVVFSDHYAENHVYAERFEAFKELDKMYLRAQRFNIVAVL